MASCRAATLALVLLAGSALSAVPAFADTIGTAAAVNPASTALPPSGTARILKIGNNVVRDERIRTSAAGSVQLLFVDRTTMSIGPGSDVVLDSYVYNPATGTGHMAVTFGKGLMRFVGGEVTHNGEADIKTTAGVIGIRGGIVLLEAGRGATGDAADLLKITVAYGRAFLRGAGGQMTTIVPGQTALVGRGGHVVVRATTAGDVQHHNTAMEHGAGHGAVHVSPALVASQLAAGAPSQLALPIAPQAPAAAGASRSAPPPVTQTDVQTTSVATGTQQTAPSTPGGGTVGPGTVFAYSMSNCCGAGNGTSFVPYLPARFFGSSTGNVTVPLLLGFDPADKSAEAALGLPVIQAGVEIDGSGGASDTLVAMAGTIKNGTLAGDFFASHQATDTSPVTTATGSFTSGVTTSSAVPISGTVKSTAAEFDVDTGAVIAGTPQTYRFSQAFAHIATPAQLSKVRADGVFNGFAAGIIDTIDHGAGTVQHLAVQSGFLGFNLSVSRDLGLVFAEGVINDGSAGTFSATYFFGLQVANKKLGTRGAYIDTDHFAALEADPVKSLTATVNGTAAASSAGAIVSSGLADLSHVSNFKPCKCEYTKWGFWAAQDTRKGGQIEDRTHLMEWVAGQIPDFSGKDIPKVGTASYGGHVVASIQNGGASYVAAGAFKSTVNFGASTGTVQVNHLDGVNYRGHIALNPSSRENFASVADMAGRDAATKAATNLRMSLDGAFYGSKANPAKEMGGEVSIRGLTPGGKNYLGSGIFAASR